VNYLRRTSILSLAFALLGCGRGANGGHGSAASSASAVARPAASSASSAAPSASASAAGASSVPLEPASPAPLPSTFVGARGEKACKAQTVELASYQHRGDVALGGGADGVAAAWRVRLGGKPQEQVAFAAFDQEGKPTARARGVGLTLQDVPPRVFASASQWTVVWFDEKGLAFARPRVEQLPQPEIAHLGAIGPDVAADVALAASPAGVLATTPFGAGKAQLGLFLFGPPDSVSTVKALGVTHHGKEPHRSAVAAHLDGGDPQTPGTGGTFVVWDEGGVLLGSRFDTAGKENDTPCSIAPAGDKRERLALAATAAGAVAMWMEGGKVRTRALDASGCPASPIWTVAEGRWASIASLGETAIVAWTGADGHLLAVRLQPSGAPSDRGIDAAEGSSGLKDPPSVLAFGAGKVAFGWSEVMGPVVSTKRLQMRIVDAACVP
jgi:hypothetical protein